MDFMRYKIVFSMLVILIFLFGSFANAINAETYIYKNIRGQKYDINFNTTTNKDVTENCKFCTEKDGSDIVLAKGLSQGTSTIFEPPYSSCYSWGKATDWLDEYSHGCNRYSGAIGVYADAFIGGATAEAMQKLYFYVGRAKSLTIHANIIRSGGTSTLGVSAFAGTEKTWSWDDFYKNYKRADVDPWWNWDIIISLIVDVVSLILGFVPTTILEAILLLNEVFDFVGFFEEMNNLLGSDKAEVIPISFSFSACPGLHTIWVGLRATASAFLAGTASAVSIGQLTNITIDGIAAPNPPIISGPSAGKSRSYLDFSAKSVDPNSDNVRYFFDWGDGSGSGWSDYVSSGGSVGFSHCFEKDGRYIVKVIAEDIDRMNSTSLKEVRISNCRFDTIKRSFVNSAFFVRFLDYFMSGK
jgi:hypothetical protein